MADAFDLLDDAVTTDKGTIYDYPASIGESFAGGLERSLDTNPLALVARQARYFSEDIGSLFTGESERVDQKAAEEEVRRRGLDLKIPASGMSRVELDMLQYLKQREIGQNTVAARSTALGVGAGFAGGLAGSLTDPINIASNFIPFVPEARYASWLKSAGESVLARAAVRVGAGAIEGAAGAALVEPIIYAGATSEQLDYGLMDSFLNVAFGGVMGGGLHAIGGGVYDYRATRALATFADGLSAAITLRTPPMPDHMQREIFHQAVAALETPGGEVRAQEFIEAWHGSPHAFDRFDVSKIGGGEGAQAFGHGLYFAESEGVARWYRDNLSTTVLDSFGQKSSQAVAKEFLDAANGDARAGIAAISDKINAKWNGKPPRFSEAGYESHKRYVEARDILSGAAPGAIYQVRLKVRADELLDWDKPLSEQSPVVRALMAKMHGMFDQEVGKYRNALGGDAWQRLKRDASPEEISAQLRAAGIKGIRYLDQGSRPIDAAFGPEAQAQARASLAKAIQDRDEPQAVHLRKVIKTMEEGARRQKTYNYVVFDDNDVEIVTRNGEPINKAQERAVAEQLMLEGRRPSPDVANPATAAQSKAPNQVAVQEALRGANETLEYKAKNGPENYSNLAEEGFSFRSVEDVDAELKRAPAAASAAVEAYGKASGWEVFVDGASDTSTYLLFGRKSDVKDADGYRVNLKFKVRISDHANIAVNRDPPDINYAPGVQGFEDVIRKIDNARISNPDDVADGELPEISFDAPATQAPPVGLPPQRPPSDLAGLMAQSKVDRSQGAFDRQFVDDSAAEQIKVDQAKPKDKIEATKADEADWREVVEQYRSQGHVTAEDDNALKQADDLAKWAESRAKAFEAAAGCIEAA